MSRKNKIGVYTCITGDYDNLKEIPKIEKGIDYYCFTNNKKIKSNTWNVIYIEDENLSNVQLARKIKILGHELINDYDILLWMDGAVTFKKNIKDFINTYLDEKDVFVCFKHGERDNIKDEANACYRFDKESKENINRILKFYEDEKYLFDNGLIESTVYIKRPKDKVVQDTMKLWFSMILNYSTRDQLSFNYCIYKTGLKVKWINEKVFSNKWFNWDNHNVNSNYENYSIYFGAIASYDMNKDNHGKYSIKNNTFSFKEKVLCDTDKICIFSLNRTCVYYSDIKITGVSNFSYQVYNSINYKDRNLLYSNELNIVLTGNFKKGDIITFSITMKDISSEDKQEFIKSLADAKIISSLRIKELEDKISDLHNTINESFICRLIFKLKNKKDI